MKKILRLLPLIMTLVVLVVSVSICIYGIYDISLTIHELASNPNASGIDYLGLGWGHGIILFVISILGLMLSIVSVKIVKPKIQKYLSMTSLVLFLLLTIISICLFFM